MEGMQEGGRESIWGLMGLRSFILNIFIEGATAATALSAAGKQKRTVPFPCSGAKERRSRMQTLVTKGYPGPTRSQCA